MEIRGVPVPELCAARAGSSLRKPSSCRDLDRVAAATSLRDSILVAHLLRADPRPTRLDASHPRHRDVPAAAGGERRGKVTPFQLRPRRGPHEIAPPSPRLSTELSAISWGALASG